MQNKKQGEASAGYMLMKPLVETATAAGARPLYDVRVQNLVVESDGRVVGMRARQYGAEMTIRARAGVVLATGSFAYNDAMVARFAPRIAGRPAASIEQHDGQAIRMAQALGADLAHMDATEVAIFIDPQQLVRAASWSTAAVSATSPRTPTRAASASSRFTTRTTPPT